MSRTKSVLLFVILAALAVLPLAHAAPTQTLTTESKSVFILDAYYDDLDGDSQLDDIKILVNFDLDEYGSSRVDINIAITLPSGTTYAFIVSVRKPPTYSILQIDCFDMAYESGWYEVQMVAFLSGRTSGRITITDVFSFDPPTGGGPGLPTVSAYF